jgi:hypothetical protein
MERNLIESVDLGKFVDWVWELKRERDELRAAEDQRNELNAKRDMHPTAQVILQWSDDGLNWSDGSEGEMVSARCAGFKTRKLYLWDQPMQAKQNDPAVQ